MSLGGSVGRGGHLLGRVAWLAGALALLHCSGPAGSDDNSGGDVDSGLGGTSSSSTTSTVTTSNSGTPTTTSSSAASTTNATTVTTTGGGTTTSNASTTGTTSATSGGASSTTSSSSNGASGFGGTTSTSDSTSSAGGASSTSDANATSTSDGSTTGGTSGGDWLGDYTATMFGQDDCSQWGFSDGTNLNFAACVSTGATTLNGDNQTWFGAPGDLASIWMGPECTCQGGQNSDPCPSPPSCNMQDTCAQCFEVRCDPNGTHSYMDDGFTHNEFCRTDQSVVIQVIDACPHNHPNNDYWCTSARPNHIDISCSAFRALTLDSMSGGRDVGDIGNINAQVRPVDCSVGLGVKPL